MALDQGPPPLLRFGFIKTLRDTIHAIFELQKYLNRSALWLPFLPSTGANPRAGTATLVAGTKTIPTGAVTANTIVLLTRKTAGGTVGNLSYTVIVQTSITINSDSVLDTSTVVWMCAELA